MNLILIPRNLSVSQNIGTFINEDGNTPVDLLGIISSLPQKQPNRLRFTLEARKIFPAEGAVPAKAGGMPAQPTKGQQSQGQVVFGKVLITLYSYPKSDFSFPELFYGDQLHLKNIKLRLPGNFNNPGNFDYHKYLKRQGIEVIAALSRPDRLILLKRPANLSFNNFMFSLRERLISIIETNFQTDEAQLIKAIILRERLNPGSDLLKNFNNSGLAHLLSVSGLHVGFIAILFYFLLHRIFMFLRFNTLLSSFHKLSFLPSRLASLFCILPVVFYTYLTGASLPTIRAAIMISTYLMAKFLGRDKNPYNILALAAWAILLWDPAAVFHIGFQLSFVAVAILIWANGFYPPQKKGEETYKQGVNWLNLSRVWPWVKERALRYLWFATAASYGTMPLVAYYFSRVNPWAPLANVITVPVGSLLVMWGAISLAVSLISSKVSYLLFFVLAVIAKATIALASFFSSIPLASVSIPTPPLGSIFAFFPLMGSVLYYLYYKKSRKLLAMSLTFTCLFLSPIIWKYISIKGPTKLSVTFLDVGQGDASYIRFPNGNNLMIDGGGFREGGADIGQIVLLPFLRHHWVSRVNLMANSHPHPDHLRGFFSVINEMKVDQIWLSPVSLENPLGMEINNLAAKKGVMKEIVTSGKRFIIAGVLVEVLYPPMDFLVSASNKDTQENNSSLVIRLSYGTKSFLFTGDIENEGEKALLPLGERLASTVLKVPHHGSNSSSTMPFLRKVSPTVGVIQVGSNNPFSHPDRRTLKRYADLGVKIYRTDRDGAIFMVTDGRDLAISTFNQPKDKLR